MLTVLESSVLSLDQFQADLLRVCGRFTLRPVGQQRQLRGAVKRDCRAGIEIAHVATDLQQIVRTRTELRSDAGQYYFLILQEEGRALMSQNDISTLMQPGDMMLIDSGSPSEFTFFGTYSRQLALHLPRDDMRARLGPSFVRGGIGLSQHEPLSIAIRAVLSKLLCQQTTDSDYCNLLRDSVFNLIGAVLHERSGNQGFAGMNVDLSSAQAFTAGQTYIDAHYRNPELTIQSIAADLGMSLRQLQRGFAVLGTTPTKYLLMKRVEHVRHALDARRVGRRTDFISTMAYEAGFSDLSYFQRCFKQAFGVSPKAHLADPATSYEPVLGSVTLSKY